MHRIYLALTLVLGLTLAAAGQPPAQNKQITDPAEYNAYVAAINEQTPANKIKMLDDFLAKYPSTVVKEDALELKLVAQQQAGQPFDSTARQILQVNPNNFRALLVLSFVFAQAPPGQQDPQKDQKLSEAEQLAQRGMQQIGVLPKPDNVSDADFQKSKNIAAATFQQVVGIVAMNRGNYAAAAAAFRQSCSFNPDNAPVFYNLGDALMRQKPPKISEALWAFARAIGVEGPAALSPAGRQQIDQYLKGTYAKHHGSEEGLDKLKSDAKASPFPPEGFQVTEAPPPPPPPVNTNPEKMSFGDIKNVLSTGGDPAKELWGKLKGMVLELEGQVVSATPPAAPRRVHLAILPATAEQSGFYDVVLTLAAPGRRLIAGKKIQFTGEVDSYKEVPFHLAMNGGKITTPAAKQAAPPARRPASKKKK